MGDVFAKTAHGNEVQHPHEWRAYKTWRYVPDIGLLMWWETPDEGEKMTVEDWLERKGYEVKIRTQMGQKLRVREVIKSLKGTTIRRYQNNVGKQVGPQLYVHRKYAAEVIPHPTLKYAAEVLKTTKPEFRFNSVMWNRDTNEVRFDEAPDFDAAREPHVGKFVAVSPNGTTREGQSNNIWHHKWLWVKDDYRGFDVDKSKEWSTLWLSKLGQVAKGTDASFGDQLKQVGLSEGVRLDAINQKIFKLEQMKQLIFEGVRENAAEDFLKSSISGTEWEGRVFAAGGYVRDQLLGKDAKDLDIVVDAPNGGIAFAEWLTHKIGNYTAGSNPVVFPRFGTAKINLDGVTHNGINLSGFEIEAVMPRGEKYIAGSRKPDTFYSNLKQDAERRDLTFNALFKNLSTGKVLDLTGMGINDLKQGVVRTPTDPNQTFTDDPLRLLRVIRFATKYGYKIPESLLLAMKNNSHQLQNISKERVRDEFNKILQTGNPKMGFELLRDTGLLPYVASEFQQMVGMTQNKHHVDTEGNPVTVFDHTIEVLKNTRPDLLERLIALFHDIGKVVTRTVTPKGVQFIGHEAEGPAIAERIMRDLKYPVDIIKAVKLGVAEHMKLKSGGDDAVALSDSTLRKFKIKLGKNLETLLRVIHADNMAHAPASQMPNQIANVIRRIKSLNIPEAPELPYDGNEIMRRFGVSGEAVGIIQDMLVNVWYKKGKLSEHDADAIIKGVMKELPRLVQKKRDQKKAKKQ